MRWRDRRSDCIERGCFVWLGRGGWVGECIVCGMRLRDRMTSIGQARLAGVMSFPFIPFKPVAPISEMAQLMQWK